MIHSKNFLPVIAASLLTLASAIPAHATGLVEAFCQSKGGTPSECTCSQTVADEHLSTADQEQFVTIADNPSAFFALASKGGEGEAFLERVTAYSEVAEARCQ